MTAEKRIIPSPPKKWSSWEDLMREALAEAKKSESKGEIPVGAIVVSPLGDIIGRGHNTVITTKDPSAHAEVVALREAGAHCKNYRLNNCILVVTLEPCMMCTGAIVHSRIAGIVYGTRDPKAGAITSCFEGLDLPFLNHFVWNLSGICEQECKEILRAFFLSCRDNNSLKQH